MKPGITFLLHLLLLLGFSAGSGAFDLFEDRVETQVTTGHGSPDINAAQREAYDGPKARVAVSRFTNRTHKRWWSREIGDGMADQLTTALFNSGRYIVLERQTLSDVLTEQDLARSGRIRQGTGAATGQIEGAELLITGAVTEFEADAGGTRGGLGGGAGNILGAIVGSMKQAHMAIDVRVIDARTSRIVAATSVQGTATDVDLGGALGSYWGGGALGGALSSWNNTPKEKALRMCIQKAVDFIVSKTPAVYYRHGSAARHASVSAPPLPASPAPRANRADIAARYAVGSIVSPSRSALNVRNGPGTANSVVFSARRGQPLRVKDHDNGWLWVETRDGRFGWIAGWLVEADFSVSAEDFGLRAPVAAASAPPPPPPPPAAAPVPASGGGGLAERLKKLKSLYDQGLITDEDYDAKRKEILESL
jgi:curli biogenesis system outer membrane secretion channel CsgG